MTGSHGFVGTNLIWALKSRYNIIRWNGREDKPLPECDVVIHLAGLAHDTKHTMVPEKYFEVNTVLTKRIYDRYLESGAKKFIFFSSIKAQDGDTAYARSKKQAEEYILSNFHNSSSWTSHAAVPSVRFKDKQVYILRPCMIHGKGNKGNLNLLVKWMKKGLPWPLAAFDNKRSFASMGNVAYVVSELLKKDVKSGIYNICDDESVSTNELIGLICESMGKKAHLWRIPKSLITGVAKLGDSLLLSLNTERLEKLTENYIIDNKDIKHALGVSRLPVKAIDGLRMTIQSMINN